MDPNTGLTANEMFRAVHDFYGHAVHGNPFGPKGEEIAYGAHSQMFSPLARMAMASETRGQNSFVNFTPLNAELMQRINRMNGVRYEAKRARDQKTVAEMDALLREAWGGFQFAPQKSLLLPPEYLDPQFTGGVPSYIQPLIKPEPGTTTAVQRYQRGGAVKQKVKGALRQAIDILSPAERQANKAKFLEESKVQERLYHATPRDFSEFMPGGENPALSGPAIWMSPSATNQPAAHNIRTIPGKPGHVYRDPNMYTPGTNVMPLYSSIKNPLVATETTWKQDFKPFGGGSPWTMTAEEVQRMKEAGHDGILYYNKNGALEEVIAFEPQQVKSAIGNRGTYDPAERDITKARGGLAAIKRRK
jgi:hypothetical protein